MPDIFEIRGWRGADDCRMAAAGAEPDHQTGRNACRTPGPDPEETLDVNGLGFLPRIEFSVPARLEGNGYMVKQRVQRRLAAVLAAAAAFSASTFLNAASEEPVQCAVILYLIEQSRSQFSAIQGDTGSDFGDYDTTFVLPDAWYCVIHEDVEKRSYQCAWKHPYGDERAHKTFERLVKEMRNCIGNIAEERRDQPVNHPDFYASYYYRLPGGEARVTLKNKSELGSTLVSIVIDGFKKAK
jgi:hypothetical protein